MLGGYEYISPIDAHSTITFLQDKFKNKGVCCDCGAGIGRVTENALINLFDTIDLVEQCPKFVKVAKSKLENNEKIGKFICVGLQDFQPEVNRYDLIWTQWYLNTYIKGYWSSH
jgi:protein N-terminal methyltransferase